MFKKNIFIISLGLCAMHHINADNADDTWQKYNQRHQEEKEAHFKRLRQEKFKEASQDVRHNEYIKSLEGRCIEGDCTACNALKTIMQEKLQERKNNDEALFKELLTHTERINIILKDPLLSDAEKKELVRPLQEKVMEFEKKLDEMGQWNFALGNVNHGHGGRSCYLQRLLPMTEENHYKLQDALNHELGSFSNIWGKKGRFWNGNLGDISLLSTSYSENAKSACLRVPTPTLHKFVTQLFQIRIIRYLNALEEIIQSDCKE